MRYRSTGGRRISTVAALVTIALFGSCMTFLIVKAAEKTVLMSYQDLSPFNFSSDASE